MATGFRGLIRSLAPFAIEVLEPQATPTSRHGIGMERKTVFRSGAARRHEEVPKDDPGRSRSEGESVDCPSGGEHRTPFSPSRPLARAAGGARSASRAARESGRLRLRRAAAAAQAIRLQHREMTHAQHDRTTTLADG